MTTAIHISHEAAKKIGGIGAVLSGLCNSSSYLSKYSETIFYGPLFAENDEELTDILKEYSNILYSSIKDLAEGKEIRTKGFNSSLRLGVEGRVKDSPPDQAQGQAPVCCTDRTLSCPYYCLPDISLEYNIDIIYGTKRVYDELFPDKFCEVGIVLVGIKKLKAGLIDIFKYRLWEKYGFRSEHHDNLDFEQYLRIAVPFNAIIRAITDENADTVLFSHEYMGVPCCLGAMLDKRGLDERKIETFFYAHEVSTARSIVEAHPGHDVCFYNLLSRDLPHGMTLEERFGNHEHNYRNELVKLAVHFNGIIAVGDWVEKEYLYLTGNDKSINSKIKVVYNGIPVKKVSFQKKRASYEKLKTYCENLFNFRPDVVFAHVTRLVVSKGLWRDIRFLEEMDKYFSSAGLSGFYILLSSLPANGRAVKDILLMEKEYGWPVLHKEGYPDLIGYENDVYTSICIFNAKSKAIKTVFINQFGFSRELTGTRIPEGTNFFDIRCGSDVELGFSIYEPFGIAQIENIPYGGVAFMSRHCGSSYLLEKCFAEAELKPYHIIDFTRSSKEKSDSDIIQLDSQQRGEIEANMIRENGETMFSIIPKNDEDRERLLRQAKRFAAKLSWENIDI